MLQKNPVGRLFFKSLSLWALLLAGAPNFQGALASDPAKNQSNAGQQITMEPLNISLFKKGRIKARLVVSLVLQIEEGAHVSYEEVMTREPQLRADFNLGLSQLAAQRFSSEATVDPDLIQIYLSQYVSARFGEGQLALYVVNAFVEPL